MKFCPRHGALPYFFDTCHTCDLLFLRAVLRAYINELRLLESDALHHARALTNPRKRVFATERDEAIALTHHYHAKRLADILEQPL